MSAYRLLRSIGAGVVESVRETLPTHEDDLGPFVAGMAWMLLVSMLVLICVTWLHLAVTGGAR